MAASKTIPVEPPDRLPDDAAEVWREVVAAGRLAPTVTAALLEAYCELVIRQRDAAKTLHAEGIVVDGGEKRGAIVHPALVAERQMSEQLREWAPLFTRPSAARRRRGPMYDATKQSIAAVPELRDDQRFTAACEAVLTLAWVIDEAQREGIDELRKVSYNVIPSYLKGCAELQITPASLPEDARKKVGRGGKVTKFEDAAARRQAQAG